MNRKVDLSQFKALPVKFEDGNMVVGKDGSSVCRAKQEWQDQEVSAKWGTLMNRFAAMVEARKVYRQEMEEELSAAGIVLSREETAKIAEDTRQFFIHLKKYKDILEAISEKDEESVTSCELMKQALDQAEALLSCYANMVTKKLGERTQEIDQKLEKNIALTDAERALWESEVVDVEEGERKKLEKFEKSCNEIRSRYETLCVQYYELFRQYRSKEEKIAALKGAEDLDVKNLEILKKFKAFCDAKNDFSNKKERDLEDDEIVCGRMEELLRGIKSDFQCLDAVLQRLRMQQLLAKAKPEVKSEKESKAIGKNQAIDVEKVLQRQEAEVLAKKAEEKAQVLAKEIEQLTRWLCSEMSRNDKGSMLKEGQMIVDEEEIIEISDDPRDFEAEEALIAQRIKEQEEVGRSMMEEARAKKEEEVAQAAAEVAAREAARMEAKKATEAEKADRYRGYEVELEAYLFEREAVQVEASQSEPSSTQPQTWGQWASSLLFRYPTQ